VAIVWWQVNFISVQLIFMSNLPWRQVVKKVMSHHCVYYIIIYVNYVGESTGAQRVNQTICPCVQLTH
jgi:uncharacterized alpha/beta hydrolase family protein